MAEGVRRMLQYWPLPSDLAPKAEADFCLALSRMHEDAGRDEQWQAAQRAVVLYRQLGDRERLADALLLQATIGYARDQLAVSEQALHEAETLVTEAAPLRKQAALAATQGTLHDRTGDLPRAIDCYRRQAELYRRAGAEIGVHLALGNVGSAQLEAGDLDAAIESLRRSVTGLRRLRAPGGLEHRLGSLAIALALRGVDPETLPAARAAFELLRSLDASYGPLMAAALHHGRVGDLLRSALVAGHARLALRQRKTHLCERDRRMDREVARLLDSASAAAVDGWLRRGEHLTEAEAAAIAFDNAPLDEPAQERPAPSDQRLHAL
jgi:tetratricopeptide (TPR) repeat protein